MTSGISGSGGPGGARGPGGPGGPATTDEAGEAGEAGEAEGAVETGAPLAAHAAAPGGAAVGLDTGGIDRIAADLDAGRISGREALDRLLDEAVPEDAGLDAAERADLREAMLELIANDPHLQALAARIGAAGGGDD
jgi:hypothetical protein